MNNFSRFVIRDFFWAIGITLFLIILSYKVPMIPWLNNIIFIIIATLAAFRKINIGKKIRPFVFIGRIFSLQSFLATFVFQIVSLILNLQIFSQLSILLIFSLIPLALQYYAFSLWTDEVNFNKQKIIIISGVVLTFLYYIFYIFIKFHTSFNS